MPRLEEFDDIQLDVEFTQAGTRSNLTSNENIAISFGKLSNQYQAGSVISLTYWSAGSISVNGTATTDNRWIHCE
jgi:hypothetical protein